jgi:replicative DNA helicase
MGNRNEQVSFVSRSLKGIARELKIPVVALSQLNRLGDNVRPELSYLRDSGSLEQDADQILFVCRLKLKTEDDVGRLEKDWNIKQEIGELSRMGLIIVGKARNEQTGQVAVEFKPDEIRYVEKKQ